MRVGELVYAGCDVALNALVCRDQLPELLAQGTVVERVEKRLKRASGVDCIAGDASIHHGVRESSLSSSNGLVLVAGVAVLAPERLKRRMLPSLALDHKEEGSKEGPFPGWHIGCLSHWIELKSPDKVGWTGLHFVDHRFFFTDREPDAVVENDQGFRINSPFAKKPYAVSVPTEVVAEVGALGHSPANGCQKRTVRG